VQESVSGDEDDTYQNRHTVKDKGVITGGSCFYTYDGYTQAYDIVDKQDREDFNFLMIYKFKTIPNATLNSGSTCKGLPIIGILALMAV